MGEDNVKRVAPSAERNKEAIREVLADVLPPSGLVLEVASGSGQHASYFASKFPQLSWQPSDADQAALLSVAAYVDELPMSNLRPPIALDAASDRWPIEGAAAVLCINMIHISPWETCLGLLRNAGRILAAGAPLILYGPFVIDGDFIAPSNVAFDERLRKENPRWGIRELRQVERAALDAGLVLERCVSRPANNQVVVFRRLATDATPTK